VHFDAAGVAGGEGLGGVLLVVAVAFVGALT
jgi:hypothetical protein